MPIYEYECENSHRFELRQSFSADPIAACPTCDLGAKRLIRAVAVHYKGSGFYVNDYGRSGSGESQSDNGDSKDSDSKKTDSTAKSSDSTSESSKESSTATAGKTGDSGD